MPQPDVMLLKAREDFYAAAHPVAADVLLLVEVADSTARLDSEIKLPLYARHGVREVWVVDLDRGVLVACRRPNADGTWAVSACRPCPIWKWTSIRSSVQRRAEVQLQELLASSCCGRDFCF
jgi:hypothetical protein